MSNDLHGAREKAMHDRSHLPENALQSCWQRQGIIPAKELDPVLGKTIAPKSQLCTDSARNYKLFASKSNIEHHAVNSRKGILIRKGIYHIQHVNAYHARLKNLGSQVQWRCDEILR